MGRKRISRYGELLFFLRAKCIMADELVRNAIDKGNEVVFFDVALGEGGGGGGGGEGTTSSNNNANSADLGRIKMELFTKDCPKTCENFRQLCTGASNQQGETNPQVPKRNVSHSLQ